MRRAARWKTQEGESTVRIFDVCILAVNGKDGLGHAEGIMEVCWQSQCYIVGLQETRRDVGRTGSQQRGSLRTAVELAEVVRRPRVNPG